MWIDIKTPMKHFNTIQKNKYTIEIVKGTDKFRTGDTVCLRAWDGDKFTGYYIVGDVLDVKDNYPLDGYTLLYITKKMWTGYYVNTVEAPNKIQRVEIDYERAKQNKEAEPIEVS